MANELKPCPFCGNKNVRRIPTNGFPAAIVCCASHGGCGATSGWHYYTEPEKDWNTRAERTCEIVRCETGEPAEYDCDEVLWHCKSCHEEVAIYAYNENGDTWADKPTFCPNCGAKVVSE